MIDSLSLFPLGFEFYSKNSLVSSQKWCKLRGNLLFYFKTNDQFSEPAGVIVLEKYRVTIPIDEPVDSFEGFPFYIGMKNFMKIFFSRVLTRTLKIAMTMFKFPFECSVQKNFNCAV